MSFFLEQDEDKNPGLQNPTAPAPQSAASSGQGQQAPQGTNSGAFTDIRKYLDANKSEAQGMGEKVGANVQTELMNQENAAKGLNDTFTSEVNQQNPLLSQDQIKQAATDPNAFIQGEGNTQNFLDTYNKQYAGPSAPVDTSSQANKVNELSELTKTSGGREQLVKDIYQKPQRATGGQLALDNALIQGTPEAIKNITDKQTEADRITNQLSQNRALQQQTIQDTQKNIQDRQMDIDQLFWQNPDSAYNTLQNQINQRTTTAQKEAEKYGKEAMDAFNLDKLAKSGLYQGKTGNGVFQDDRIDADKVKISDAALTQLGMSKKEYIDVLNKINQTNRMINNALLLNESRDPGNSREDPFLSNSIPELLDTGTLQSYIKNVGTKGITSSNVANADEYAELAALSQLLGEKNPQLDFKYLSSPNKASSYNTDITNFEKKQFNNFLNDIFEKISNPVQQTSGWQNNSSR